MQLDVAVPYAVTSFTYYVCREFVSTHKHHLLLPYLHAFHIMAACDIMREFIKLRLVFVGRNEKQNIYWTES